MAWDRTKPVAGADLESAPVRSNFQAIDEAVGAVNLLANPEKIIWPAGSSTNENQPPAHYRKIGSPAISCVTSGKRTKYSSKLTYSGSGTDGLEQDVVPSSTYNGELDGANVSVAAWVKSTSSNAKIGIGDGDTESLSSAHTGGGAWELLTATHTIGALSTKLTYFERLQASGDMEVNQPTMIFGPIPPQDTKPGVAAEGTLQFPITGNITTGVIIGGRFNPWRPLLITDASIVVGTPPTATTVRVMLQKWDGSSWLDVYTTGLDLTTGKAGSFNKPDATSTRDSAGGSGLYLRSFLGKAGAEAVITTTDLADRRFRVRINQADDTSTNPAADAEISIRLIQYQRPMIPYLLPEDEN